MLVQQLMTAIPFSIEANAPIADAARVMREHDIGDVIIRQDQKVLGILTDRDIVVRVLAEDRDPRDTTAGSVCSPTLTTVTPDAEIVDAVKLMREKSIRRLPVVENGSLVGIVSLGDLAIAIDRNSALGEISAAPANR